MITENGLICHFPGTVEYKFPLCIISNFAHVFFVLGLRTYYINTSFFTYFITVKQNTVLKLTKKIKSEKIFFGCINDLVTSK